MPVSECWGTCVTGTWEGYPTPSLACLPQDVIKPSQGMSRRTGVPAGTKRPPCKRGCMDAASFAVPWLEGTGTTSNGPFPVLKHQETFLVSQSAGNSRTAVRREKQLPWSPTGHALQLTMVTPSFHSGVQCFPRVCTFLPGFLNHREGFCMEIQCSLRVVHARPAHRFPLPSRAEVTCTKVWSSAILKIWR